MESRIRESVIPVIAACFGGAANPSPEERGRTRSNSPSPGNSDALCKGVNPLASGLPKNPSPPGIHNRRNDEQNRKGCRERPPFLSGAQFRKGLPQGVVPTNPPTRSSPYDKSGKQNFFNGPDSLRFDYRGGRFHENGVRNDAKMKIIQFVVNSDKFTGFFDKLMKNDFRLTCCYIKS